MGVTLYVLCEDGDYVHYGKELEVYANQKYANAMLMFILNKFEFGKTIWIRRFDLHEGDYGLMKNDVSEKILRYVTEGGF